MIKNKWAHDEIARATHILWVLGVISLVSVVVLAFVLFKILKELI